MSIKVNTDRTAAVNKGLPWLKVGPDTPRGVKLQLINRSAGSASYGHYRPEEKWTHWQGLPYFEDNE